MHFRVLFLIAAAFGCASFSHAAGLTVVADRTHYAAGATITLTVTGTINPVAGEVATNIDVRLAFTNATFVSSTAETALNPAPMFGPPTSWTVQATQGTLVGGEVMVFGQIQGLPPGGPFVNNCNATFTDCFVTGTVVMTAGSPGTADFDFGALTDFFNVHGASPGTSVTIGPEPLSGGNYQIHEGVISPAATPVLENASGTLRLKLATVGTLAAGLSHALSGLQLQAGVLPVPEPALGAQLGVGIFSLLMLTQVRSRRGSRK